MNDKINITKILLSDICKKLGYTSITNFCAKTDRHAATVFGHINSGVISLNDIRDYSRDLKITFFEVLNVFRIGREESVMKISEKLGFEVCNNAIAKKGNYLLSSEIGGSNTFSLMEIDPETLESNILLKIGVHIAELEIIEHLIKKAICK